MGVENFRTTGVVDTGAGVSVVSEETVVRIQNLHPKRLTVYPCETELQGANKTKIHTVGVVQLNFRLGRKKYEHWFLVTKCLPYDLILGNDFLGSIDAVINVKRALILISGEEPIRGSCKPNDSVLLRARKPTTVAGRARSFVGVVRGPMLWEEGTTEDEYVVEPFSVTFEDEFVVEHQVHKVKKDEWFGISLANHSDSPVFIEQGQVIARMVPADGRAAIMSLFAANNVGQASEARAQRR